MMARKNSNHAETVELVVDNIEAVSDPVETTVEIPSETDINTVEAAEETVEHDYEKENQVLQLESELVKLQERIKEVRKQLRKLEAKPKADGPTKMELATEYVKNHPQLARKDYIQAFKTELGLTEAGARTYIQLILTRMKTAE